jgi:hypothetical protein
MGKLKKTGSATKTQLFEGTSIQTRRGQKFVNVPVHTPPTPRSTSRSISPSKKRAWSPGSLQPGEDNPTFQLPKRSRRSGKVGSDDIIPLELSDVFTQTQNEFLDEYLHRRQELLIELIRHEAPLRNRSCYRCSGAQATHRCRDCFTSYILCGSCCLSAHLTLPFHRIQRFNGQYFENADLDDLGLVLNLCQHPGDCIPITPNTEEALRPDSDLSEEDDIPVYQPSTHGPTDHRSSITDHPTRSNLIVVSSMGIFKRSVKWCQCADSPERYVQLLRAKLFPASFKRPSTAFTFEVLDHFRIDALECHTAAMNFMSKIARITNEAFPDRVPVCTHALNAFILTDGGL